MKFNFEAYNYENDLVEMEKEKINYFLIISKDKQVDDSEFESVIQIVDEEGDRRVCTSEKFIEIFDEKGLSGFI